MLSFNEAQIDELRLLVIEENANINYTNRKGSSPFMLLCNNNESDSFLTCFNIFMERDDLDVNIRNDQGLDAFLILCKYNSKVSNYTVQKLIQRGADIHQKTTDGFTSLALLCQYSDSYNRLEVARSLMDDGGIDILAVTASGDNALTLLMKNEKNQANSSLLEMAHLLVTEKKVPINHTNRRGESALHLLCLKNVIEGDQLVAVIEFLISSGIKLSTRTVEGSNALLLLCRRTTCPDLLRVARLLMERGGVNAQTTAYHGNNALTLLCSYSDDKDMV